jgi:CBS-domain-containing membrane protein
MADDLKRRITGDSAMRAAEIGSSQPAQASSSLGLGDASRMLRHQPSGCLVIVRNEAGGAVPVGIVTDRDVVVRGLAAGRDTAATVVGRIMSSPVVTCSDDNTLEMLVSTMCDAGVRHLPRIDARGYLSGIVSADDVLAALAGLMARLSDTCAPQPLSERLQA